MSSEELPDNLLKERISRLQENEGIGWVTYAIDKKLFLADSFCQSFIGCKNINTEAEFFRVLGEAFERSLKSALQALEKSSSHKIENIRVGKGLFLESKFANANLHKTDSFNIEICIKDTTATHIAERHLRTLVGSMDSAKVGYTLIDKFHNVVWINDALERRSGYKREEVIGKNLINFLYCHNKEQEQEVMVSANMALNGKESHIDVRKINRYGRTYWVRLYFKSFDDEAGNIIGYTVSSLVIDEFMSTQAKLKYQILLFESIFENSADALLLTRHGSFEVLRANQRTLQLFESPDFKSIRFNLSYNTLRNPFQSEEYKQVLQDFEQKGSFSLVSEFQTLQGNYFWGNYEARLLSLDGEQYVLHRISDISLYKNAELNLARREELYRLLLENLPLSTVLVLDRNFTVTLAEGGNLEVMGIDTNELLGKPFSSLLSSDDAKLIEDKFKQAFEGKTVSFSKLLKSGKFFDFYAAPIVDDTGYVRFIATVSMNATERYQNQRLIEENETLLRRTQSLAMMYSFVFDVQTQTAFWSDEFFTIVESSKEEFGYDYTKFEKLLDPNDREVLFPDVLKRMYEGQDEFNYNFKIKLASGKEKVINLVAKVERDSNGNLLKYVGIAKDVTEELKRENALKDSELRYRRLFMNSPFPMWMVDLETLKFIEVNQAAIALYGYTNEEFAELTIIDVRSKADQNRIPTPDTTIEEGFNSYGIWNHRKKNGEEITVIPHWQEYEHPDTRKNYRIVIIQDITDSIKAEEELKYQRHFLRRILDTDRNIIFVKDREGKFLLVNNSMAEIYGCKPEDMIGKTDYDFVDQQFADEYAAIDREVLETGIDKVYEDSYIKLKTKKELYVIANKSKLTNPNGTESVLCVCYDISERKRYEKELIDSQAQFKTVFDLSPDALFLVKPGTGHIIHDCNNTAVTLFECDSKEELLGLFGPALHADEDSIYISDEELEAYLDKNTQWSAEIKYRSKQGREFWGLLSFTRLYYNNDSHYLVRVTDVNDLKSTQQALQKSLHEKETLIKEIHHRVKNNMAVISGLLQLQCAYITDPASIVAFRESQNRIKGMALIHEQLYQNNTLSSINFSNYIKSLTGNLSATITMNKPVKIEVDSNEVELDITDAVPCGLIINEIVTNSYKHAFTDAENGTISIQFKFEDDLNKLTISDNGKGMEPDIMNKNLKSLGLTLIRELCRQLRATVEVKVDKGTTYIITFAGKKIG